MSGAGEGNGEKKGRLSSTLMGLKFMQRAQEKKVKGEEAEARDEREDEAHWVVAGARVRCVVLAEGDPPPAAAVSRFSFGGANPGVEALTAAVATEREAAAAEAAAPGGKVVSDEHMAAALRRPAPAGGGGGGRYFSSGGGKRKHGGGGGGGGGGTGKGGGGGGSGGVWPSPKQHKSKHRGSDGGLKMYKD